MDQSLFLIVIAGGSGTRFWPKSTSKKPKQLLTFQNESLLAQTVHRFKDIVPLNQSLVVTTETLNQPIADENLGIQILAEPQGRNTAPCIYWAAREVYKKNPKGIMLLMPSDHYIKSKEKFIAAVLSGASWARENNDLVTLGILPSRPETGYGYLRLGKPIQSITDFNKNSEVKKVDAFVEKPNLEKAKEFIESKNYLWNGGMFIWRAEVILKAFDQYMPEMKAAWEKADGNVKLAYPFMTATSIDYGIMEKADNVVTLPLDCGWDDLGSWTSLENLASSLGAQKGNNVVMNGDLISIESSGNIIDIPHRFISLLGVKDLIIVENGDAILVAHKERAQEIRKVVDAVKNIRPDLV